MKKKRTDGELDKLRERNIFKSNMIIQRAKFDLSVNEQKILAYVLTMVKKEDKPHTTYTFSIREYCEICEINNHSGRNYSIIKNSLKKLRDKSFWLELPNGSETTISWLSKATIQKKSGTIKVELDSDLQKYVQNLIKNFTVYSFISILPLTSKYSIRLYELLKSYQNMIKIKITLEELRNRLGVNENQYTMYSDFRIKAIDNSIAEINKFTDIYVSYVPIREGRKITQLEFTIRQKSTSEGMTTTLNQMKYLNDKKIQRVTED